MKIKLPLALTLALLPAMASAQNVTLAPAIAGTRLDIAATGESKRVPDIAAISAGVVTQSPDASAALRDNAARMSRVIAALKRAGVAERDIATSQISLNPQYRYGENVPPTITSYQAQNTVTVRFRDVRRSGAILDALVSEGANSINGPNLMLDQPQAAEDEARRDAIAKARARAELYAAAAGLRVKRIVSISESGGFGGPMPPPMVRMEMASDAAQTKIEPGEQTIGVTVNVSFELE